MPETVNILVGGSFLKSFSPPVRRARILLKLGLGDAISPATGAIDWLDTAEFGPHPALPISAA